MTKIIQLAKVGCFWYGTSFDLARVPLVMGSQYRLIKYATTDTPIRLESVCMTHRQGIFSNNDLQIKKKKCIHILWMQKFVFVYCQWERTIQRNLQLGLFQAAHGTESLHWWLAHSINPDPRGSKTKEKPPKSVASSWVWVSAGNYTGLSITKE